MEEGFTFRLNDIFEELVTGRYHQVMEKAQKILHKSEIDEEERIEAMILKCRSLFQLAIFEIEDEYTQEGTELINEAFQKSLELEDSLLMFETNYMKIMFSAINYKHEEVVKGIKKAEEIYQKLKLEYPPLSKEKKAFLCNLKSLELIHKVHLNQGFKWNLKESVEYSETGLKLSEQAKHEGTPLNKELPMFLNDRIGESFNRNGNYERAVEYHFRALSIAREIGNDYWISNLLQKIGIDHWRKGEYNLLLEYTMKAKEIREKQGNTRGIGDSYVKMGLFYGSTGEWKKCLEYTQKAYDILSENGKRKEANRLLNNIGASYNMMGDTDKALEYYEKSVKHNKKIGDNIRAHFTLANIAEIHMKRGELEKALELLKTIMEFFEKKGLKAKYSDNLDRLGFLYRRKGLFNKALEYYEKALSYYQEVGNKKQIAFILYELISLAVEFNRFNLAIEYNKKLAEITEDTDYKLLKNLALVSEAVILKSSSETRDRIRAEVLLEHQLNEESGYLFHIEVLFHLCDLLLSELKTTSDKKILTKLQKYVNLMIKLATKNYNSHLIVESLWFKSQLALLNLNIEKARELLTQALNIAEDKGLNHLALKMTKSKEDLIKLTIELEELEKTSPKLSDRMELVKIDNGFNEMRSAEIFQFKQDI